jgi:hypothetical protein
MKNNFSCPSCRHKLVAQPLTGKCPKCDEYNFAWNIVNKKNFIRRLKLKMYGNLTFAIIFIISALIFMGSGYSSVPVPHAGKSVFFIVIGSALHAMLFPYFGVYTVSAAFFSVALIFLAVSYGYYRKMGADDYDSHSPLG